MKILVMVSGGLESAALAYYLLAQHPVAHDIQLHHMRLRGTAAGQRDKVKATQLAVENMVSWLRWNCRPFDYSESDMKLPPSERSQHDTSLWVAMVGANLLNLDQGQIMATGRVAPDAGSDGMPRMLDVFNFLVSDEKGLGRVRVQRDTYDTMEWVPAYWVTPIGSWTKADCLERLPQGLLDLISSCHGDAVTDVLKKDRFIWPVTLDDVERLENSGVIY